MIQFPDIPFPTLERAGIASLPAVSSSDALAIAQSWLDALSSCASSADASGVLALLHPYVPFWRDVLALTWDLRTFFGTPDVERFLKARLAGGRLSDFALVEAHTGLRRPFPDVAWVDSMFRFETAVGSGTGVARLVPLRKDAAATATATREIERLDEVEWRAYVVLTNLDSLRGFPEKIGSFRDANPNRTRWAARREAEAEFLGAEEDEAKAPRVLLVGAGQSGLETAVRLKALGVPALIVDKNDRIGDNWRNRYEALCLHDPVWYDHMPYLPFPPTWPVFCPAQKLANWLENYADTFELNIWLSSTVSRLWQDPQSDKWHVTVVRRRRRPDGEALEQVRKFVVKHVIFCTGVGSPNPRVPTFPGMDDFKGEIMHSSQYRRAADLEGKTVVVVGACTSAHDICEDCYEQGVDVTMIQRSSSYVMSTANGFGVMLSALYSETSPPAEVSDVIFASFPLHSMVEISRRQTEIIAKLDEDILDSLHRVGFRTNLGHEGTGLMAMVLDKCGGYYLDTGASRLVADGKIKLKSDSPISRFAEGAVVFEDGSKLDADVVVFATGIGDTLDRVTAILSDAKASPESIERLNPVWGVDEEGEINGAWSYAKLGPRGLWYVLGNLALCRFYSMRVALQIKAMEEGIWSGVYEG